MADGKRPHDVDEESSAPLRGLLRLHQELFRHRNPSSPSLFPYRSFSPCRSNVSSVASFFVGSAASSGPREWIAAQGGAGMSAAAIATLGSPPLSGSSSSSDSDPPEE